MVDGMAHIERSSDDRRSLGVVWKRRCLEAEAEVERLRANYDAMSESWQDAESRCDRLREQANQAILARNRAWDAIAEYRLWRPGEKGHAAAHRKLMEVLDG